MANTSTATTGQRDLSELLTLLDLLDEAPAAVALRTRSYELLGVGPGTRLLDVGCGGGRAVGESAALGAAATGVDANVGMVAAARERWPGQRFEVAAAEALPYPDGSFDACRAEKVLHELTDPAAAVAEAYRVLVPGGRVALIGQDWDTLVIDSALPALTRAIVAARADLMPSARVARGYRNLLLDGGFGQARVAVDTAVFTDGLMLPVLGALARAAGAAGAVSAAEAEVWLSDQRERAADGRAFVAIPLFTATAVRP